MRKAEARAFLWVSEGTAGQGSVDSLALSGLNHSSELGAQELSPVIWEPILGDLGQGDIDVVSED